MPLEEQIETREQIAARLTAQRMAESSDPIQQTVGLTALQVTAIHRQLKAIEAGLWTEETMRGWIKEEICKEKKPQTSFGKVAAVVSDTRLLLLIILALVLLLGRSLKVDLTKEVNEVAKVGSVR